MPGGRALLPGMSVLPGLIGTGVLVADPGVLEGVNPNLEVAVLTDTPDVIERGVETAELVGNGAGSEPPFADTAWSSLGCSTGLAVGSVTVEAALTGARAAAASSP